MAKDCTAILIFYRQAGPGFLTTPGNREQEEYKCYIQQELRDVRRECWWHGCWTRVVAVIESAKKPLGIGGCCGPSCYL